MTEPCRCGKPFRVLVVGQHPGRQPGLDGGDGAPPHPEIALDGTCLRHDGDHLTTEGRLLGVDLDVGVDVRGRSADVHHDDVPGEPAEHLDGAEHHVRGRSPDGGPELRSRGQVLATDHVLEKHPPDRCPGGARLEGPRSWAPRCRPPRTAYRRPATARLPRRAHRSCRRGRPARTIRRAVAPRREAPRSSPRRSLRRAGPRPGGILRGPTAPPRPAVRGSPRPPGPHWTVPRVVRPRRSPAPRCRPRRSGALRPLLSRRAAEAPPRRDEPWRARPGRRDSRPTDRSRSWSGGWPGQQLAGRAARRARPW